MTASRLLTNLRNAGLIVVTDSGWERRGNRWAVGDKPIGVMHHHTTLPVPYPINRLNGSGDGRIKCNINTKSDGTVWMVAYRACNYSSGKGSSVVYKETQRGVAPRANARDRGLVDDMYGNRFYFNFENDHPGNGSPIPQIQLNAIVLATQVVNDYYNLDPEPNKDISHAEWTRRKIDPYWNRDRRSIVDLRSAVGGTPPTLPTPDPEDAMLPLRHKDGWSSGPRPHKRDDVALLQAMFGLDYGSQQGFYGPQTAEDIGSVLGTGPVTEFGFAEAQIAAEKGIFVGGGSVGGTGYTKAEADNKFADKDHPHNAEIRLT